MTHGVVPLTHAAATDSCSCQRRGIVHDFERHSSGLGVFGRLCVSVSVPVCLCVVSRCTPGIGYLLLPPGES